MSVKRPQRMLGLGRRGSRPVAQGRSDGGERPDIAAAAVCPVMRRVVIIGAFACLLEAGVALVAEQPVAGTSGQGTPVCHYTGSESAPYVLVQAPPGGGEHRRHPNDIIPAPAGGCPSTVVTPAPAPAPRPQSGVVTL